MEMEQQAGQFKPNMYPLMYWALAFGAISGVALFLMYLLSQFITLVWFPVFLAGLIWGGYRNYKQQKEAWMKGTGTSAVPQSPIQEFKEAVGDVVNASRQMMAEQRAEDAAATEALATKGNPEEIVEPASGEEVAVQEEEIIEQTPEQPQPFVAPQPPRPFVPPAQPPQPPTPPQNVPPQNQPPTV